MAKERLGLLTRLGVDINYPFNRQDEQIKLLIVRVLSTGRNPLSDSADE